MSETVACDDCVSGHPREAIELAFRLPDIVFAIDEEERVNRYQLIKDLCILDRVRFFVRGLSPIPVHGRDAAYRMGLWVEVEEATFERYRRTLYV